MGSFEKLQMTGFNR